MSPAQLCRGPRTRKSRAVQAWEWKLECGDTCELESEHLGVGFWLCPVTAGTGRTLTSLCSRVFSAWGANSRGLTEVTGRLHKGGCPEALLWPSTEPARGTFARARNGPHLDLIWEKVNTVLVSAFA